MDMTTIIFNRLEAIEQRIAGLENLKVMDKKTITNDLKRFKDTLLVDLKSVFVEKAILPNVKEEVEELKTKKEIKEEKKEEKILEEVILDNIIEAKDLFALKRLLKEYPEYFPIRPFTPSHTFLRAKKATITYFNKRVYAMRHPKKEEEY